MKLLINNLGAITNNTQSIDLDKNFYVFVGANNSGKTYVSQLLWTIYNPKNIIEFWNNFYVKADFIFKDKNNLFEVSEDLIKDILSKYANFVKKEFNNTLQVKNGIRNNSLSDNLIINFEYDYQAFLNIEKKGIFVSTMKIVKDVIDEKMPYQNVIISLEKRKKDTKIIFDSDIKLVTYASFIFEFLMQILFNIKDNITFLPANRAFYPNYYQYIVQIDRENAEKKQAALNDFLRKNIEEAPVIFLKKFNDYLELVNQKFTLPYTLPINDLLKKLFELNTNSTVQNSHPEILAQIIDLMGGDIITNSVEGISMSEFMFKVKNTDQELPMYLSSSSVNQLTLLYLYFKYWANNANNFLMVDEPEENLNPKNQIKLLDALINFSNKDNKVLINTHSPLLADVVNNYLCLGILKDKYDLDPADIIKENELQYLNPNTFISPQNLGVYFFEGSRIIDYTDENYAVHFRDFKQVTNAVEKAGNLLTDFIYLKERE